MASVHDLRGCCDLCGLEADSEVVEVVALNCSYKNCVPDYENIYHQACLEKYLKSMKCERNRKIGYFCPRGHGKNTKFPDRCKGKITKSHPVSIRSEGNKKRRQAEVEGLNRTISADNEAKGKAMKKQGAKEALAAKEINDKAPVITKPIAIGKASANTQIKALNIGNTAFTKLAPPKPPAQVEKDKAKEAAERIRAELAAKNMGTSLPKPKLALAPAKPREKTLDEYLAERSASSLSNSSRVERQSSTSTASIGGAAVPSQPASNAWGRMRTAPSSGIPLPPATSDTLSLQLPLGTDVEGSDSGSSYATYSAWGGPNTKASTPRSPLSVHQGMGIQPFGGGGVDGASGLTEPSPLYIHPTGQAEIIPGMLATAEPLTGLTKAQRKNLKRAEKKAAAKTDESTHETESNASLADGSAGPSAVDSAGVHLSMSHDADIFALDHAGNSLHHTLRAISSLAPPPESMMPILRRDGVASPAVGACAGLPPSSFADDLGAAFRSDPDGDVASQCMRSIVQHKLQTQVEHLLSLGFPTDATVGAVVRSGGNLEAAISLLLSPEGGEYALAGNGQADDVDISEELAHVQMLKARYTLLSGAVESAIVVCDGDLSAAGTMLHEQCTQKAQTFTPPQQQQQQQQAVPPLQFVQPHAQQTHQQQQQSQGGGLFGNLGLGGNDGNGWGSQNVSSSPAPLQGLAFTPLHDYQHDVSSPSHSGGGGGGGGTWSLFGIGGLTEAAISAVNGSPLSQQHTQPQNMLPQSMLHGGNPPLYNGGGLGLGMNSPRMRMDIRNIAPSPNNNNNSNNNNGGGVGGGLWGSGDLNGNISITSNTGSPGMGFISMMGPGSPAASMYMHHLNQHNQQQQNHHHMEPMSPVRSPSGGYPGSSMYQGGQALGHGSGMGSPGMSPNIIRGVMPSGTGSLWSDGPMGAPWSPLGNDGGGGGGSGGSPFGPGPGQQQQQQYHHSTQPQYTGDGRDLNDLMSSLGVCR